jgi:DNA-binding transcriptional ArsR family regulator
VPSPSRPEARLRALEAVCAALAHPARRTILLAVHYRGGAMAAGAIAERFSCSWPTTTRHLRVLVDAGLLRVTRRGRTRTYRLVRARLGVLGDWLRLFRR